MAGHEGNVGLDRRAATSKAAHEDRGAGIRKVNDAMIDKRESEHWVLEDFSDSDIIILRAKNRATGWAFENWDDLRELAEFILASLPQDRQRI